MIPRSSPPVAGNPLRRVITWLIRGFLALALLVIMLLAALYFILDTQRGK
jgi:hypothetical protein